MELFQCKFSQQKQSKTSSSAILTSVNFFWNISCDMIFLQSTTGSEYSDPLVTGISQQQLSLQTTTVPCQIYVWNVVSLAASFQMAFIYSFIHSVHCEANYYFWYSFQNGTSTKKESFKNHSFVDGRILKGRKKSSDFISFLLQHP